MSVVFRYTKKMTIFSLSKRKPIKGKTAKSHIPEIFLAKDRLSQNEMNDVIK